MIIDLVNHGAKFRGVELAVVHGLIARDKKNTPLTILKMQSIDSASRRRLAAYLNSFVL